MAALHAIHEDLPDDAGSIHRPKLAESRFAWLLEQGGKVSDRVSWQATITDRAETGHRKRRAMLKGKIALAIAAQ